MEYVISVFRYKGNIDFSFHEYDRIMLFKTKNNYFRRQHEKNS